MVKVDIQKVKMDWLSVECLVLLSKYVEIAHEHDGTILPLQSANLLKLVVHHVRQTDSIELREIYDKLKGQIKVCLADPRLKETLGIDSKDQDYYEEDTSHVDYRNFAA